MVIILLSWGANISLSCNVRRVFMTLTKADIAQKIADDCGFMKGEATEVFEKILDIIKTSSIAGEGVMISGFGKWSMKDKNARRGRNPQMGNKVGLPRET
jgi:integration host factor subunit alpha